MINSKLIITLLIIIILLVILHIILSKKKENFESKSPEDNTTIKVPKPAAVGTKAKGVGAKPKAVGGSNEDLDFGRTSDYIKYSQNPYELKDMFKSLEEAEKKCAELEDFQYLKNERENMRENDKVFKELQEQDKKISELKEIVKYLTIEKKRRDKINNKCRNNAQVKLNKEYDIVRKLNEEKLVSDNSINLDVNLTNSEIFKQLKLNNANQDNKTKEFKARKCRSKGDGFVNIDTKDIGKCYGCSADKLKKNEPYILNDFK